jgi:hypothetical protein
MGVIIPEGYGQLSMDLYVSGDNEAMTSTIGWDNAPGGFSDPQEAADAFFAILTDTGAPFEPSNVADEVTVGPFRATIGTASGPLTGPGLLTEVGTAGVNALPNNCTLLVRKVTATGGRKGRGRMYIYPAGTDESVVDRVGVIGSLEVAAEQAKWDQVFAAVSLAELDFVLLHSDATAPSPITSLVVDPRIATQRRRLRP